jgi:transmembrane sensor
LGTRFTITSYAALGNVKVSVEHGRVKVSSPSKTLGILTKDQALRYNLTSHRATTEEITSRFDPEHNTMFLSHCSFTEFVVRLESIYGLKVYAGNAEVLQYSFTGEILLKEPLDITLQKFCAIHGGSFTLKDNKVYIY